METGTKRRDKLNLSGLTALSSNGVKQLSKSQTSLYRLSPLLTNEEASLQILHHGHSVGDLNKTNPSLRSQRISSVKERVCHEEIRKSSAPSSDALKTFLTNSRSYDIPGADILTGSLPSLPSADAMLNQSPKRQRHRYSRQRKTVKTQSMLMDYRENSLSEFAAKYCDYLPLQVQIQNGYSSPCSSVSLLSDDMCNLYFMHKMDVVTGSINGNLISVPLHTNVQFCLIHDPDSNVERALMGYEYESIRDVIAANPRPKVIRSLSHWEDDHATVDDDDILVVIGTILLPGDETVWLEAFSLKFHSTLQLHPNCRAIFTTRPQLLPLYLSDIVEYVPDIFPCTVQVYGYQQPATKDLEIKVIHFHRRMKESVIVCSTSAFDDPLLALPTKNSVTVKLLNLKRNCDNARQIRKRAEAILANFSPSRCVYLVDTKSSSLFDFQSLLYRTLKEDSGVCLPSNITMLSSSVELPEYRPYQTVESTNASQVRKISCEPAMDEHHMVTLAQDLVEAVEISSSSSLSDGSALSSSEPTPPTPPRPWRRCGSAQDELLVLQEQPSSSEELYLSPLSSQAHGVFNLYSFAKRYGTQLPVTADVKDGYVDLNGIQISRGDVITVHGIAYTMAVSVKDDQDKVYVLPVDATSEFGVLQEDAFRLKFGDEAVFETIGDIIAKEKIPTILCARSQYTGGSPRCSVEANEILVVKKVKKMTKMLKVYSVTMEMKKTLPSKCAGHFTTAPRAVKLKISNLLEHFSGLLPGKAVAFPDAYCSELPAQLEFSVVTLTSVHPANSLIFSCQSQNVMNGELDLFSVSLDHYLHLQSHDVQSREPIFHPSELNHSKSIPQINVSTFPRTQRGTFQENAESKKENNIKFLATMNENQVLQLLDAMHLKKYKKAFKDEKINGNIFCMFDEKIMQDDLGVDSRLHRIRLMQIVNGEADARLYLSTK